MKCLLILGAGGHGKVVAETADTTGLWDEIAFLDDRYPSHARVLDWPVIGMFSDLQQLSGDIFGDAHVALGDNSLRLHWLEKLQHMNFKLPALVHSRAWISPSAKLGNGCTVMAGAIVNASSHFGKGCIINTGSTVDHDCRIGEGVHICPGAHISGDVELGNRAWLGVGCVVRQGIKIGEGVIVGAGAAVINPVANGLTVAGVPATLLDN